MRILDIIETPKAEIALLENQIIRLRFTAIDVDFDVDDAILVDAAYEKFCDGKAYRSLVDARDARGNLTKEAKKHFADNEPLQGLRIAEAIVVNSLHNRILGKLYLSVFRPNNPCKVFDDMEKAILWLQIQSS